MRKILALFLLTSLGFNTIFANTLKDAIIAYQQKNYKEAKKLFETAIEKENSKQANFFLGRIYLFGEGIEKNPKLALSYLQKAEKSGNIKAKCLKIKALLKIKKEISKEDEMFLKSDQAKNIKECKDIKISVKDKK